MICVRVNQCDGDLDKFRNNTQTLLIQHGTKQGCVLSSNLFTIFLTVVLIKVRAQDCRGVYIRIRHDGKLFNLARLKTKTKIITQLLLEPLFADDTALLAHSISDMQNTVDKFVEASKEMGLNVNITETEVLYEPAPNFSVNEVPIIQIDGIPLKAVKNFRYIGSTISQYNRVDIEVHNRIQSACSAFGKLVKRLWSQSGISISTKCKVYRAVVLPTLLYSVKTHTLYRNDIKKLNFL